MLKRFACALLPLLLAACTLEVLPQEGGDSFSAGIEDGGKTYIDPGLKVRWNAGDKVSIFDSGRTNAEYYFAGSDGDLSGTLKRTDGGSAGEGPYTAVYPYRSTTTISSDGTVRLGLQSKQTWAPGSFGPGACAMIAVSEGRELLFRNVCGALVLRFTGTGEVSSLTLRGNAGEALAGTASVDMKDGIPASAFMPAGSGTSLKLSCESPVTLGTDPAEFWFSLLPVKFTQGFTVSLSDASGRTVDFSTSKPIEIKRNTAARMSPQTVDFAAPDAVVAGEPLPLWRPGWLDIHGINGGRGEAFYYIMPDGTTMLVDAAGAPPHELYDYGEGNSPGVPSRPSADMTSGAVIVDYIRHFAPAVAGGRLDYFMSSHYHGDHIGAWRSDYSTYGWPAKDKNGNTVSSVNLNAGGFVVNGVSAVGMEIPIDKVLDRGDWASRPSIDYYSSTGKKRYDCYVNFLDYSARAFGTVRETLRIGHTDQIVLRHSPADYTGFSIRTIASGGDIWTGSGTGVNTSYVPSAAECDAHHEEWEINENIFSNVFHLSYGKFDWFSGGDIQFSGKSYQSWKDIELPISKVMKKVEAMKASHHSTKNTNSTELLGVLKPDVYIAGVWRDVQPNPATIKRVLTASPSVKIFTTNLTQNNISTLKGEGVDASKFSATGGHVVVRVLPGGGSYYVFVLDDSDCNYRVKAIHGPFTCK